MAKSSDLKLDLGNITSITEIIWHWDGRFVLMIGKKEVHMQDGKRMVMGDDHITPIISVVRMIESLGGGKFKRRTTQGVHNVWSRKKCVAPAS